MQLISTALLSFIFIILFIIGQYLIFLVAEHKAKNIIISNMVNGKYFEHGKTLYSIKKVPVQGLLYCSNKLDEEPTEHA